MGQFMANMQKNLNTAKLKIQKKSPEICLVLGITCFVGAIVTSNRATLKAKDVLELHKERMAEAEEANDVATEEDGFDIQKEKTAIVVKTGVSMVKLYALPVGLSVAAIRFLVKGHNTLNDRYLGAVSAFNGVSGLFNSYRERVRKEEGIEKDRHYYYGTKEVTHEKHSVDADGNEYTEPVVVEDVDEEFPEGTFTLFFDENHPEWDASPTYNRMLLLGRLNMCNDILHSKGYLTFNQAKDVFGFEDADDPVGMITGWIDDEPDKKVDIGIFDPTNEQNRLFVNGKSNVAILQFNVDGIIWDKI